LTGAICILKIESRFCLDFANGIKPSSVGDSFLGSLQSPPISFAWGKKSLGWPRLAYVFVARMGSERHDVARGGAGGTVATLASVLGTPSTELVSWVRHLGNNDWAGSMKKIGLGPWPYKERRSYSNFKYFLYKQVTSSISNQT
jgi:hypothetical protein